jgi:hypothetical protein
MANKFRIQDGIIFPDGTEQITAGGGGIQGIQGLQGVDGSPGGAQGVQGLQGADGVQGLQGADGAAGIPGNDGTPGTQGLQGADGAIGIPGNDGTPGTQGTQGIQGLQGTDGTSIQGIQGTTGPADLDDSFESKSSATGTVTHDCTSNRIFIHSSVSANFTANLTNLNLASGSATVVTLLINQGAIAYICNAIQIGGVGQTITWQGSTSAPSGNANKKDAMAFSIFNISGTYTVLGQLVSFG